MLLAARQNWWGGGYAPPAITTSMYNNGDLGSNCVYNFSGSGTLGITFSCWALTEQSLGQDSDVLFQYGNSSNGMAMSTSTNNGNSSIKRAAILCEGKYWLAYGDGAVYNSWDHWVVTITNGTNPFRLFKNGSVVAKYPYSGGSAAVTAPTQKLYLLGGFWSSDSQRRFKGYETRFSMWNRILSDNEIADDYALGATAPTISSDLVHYWDGTLENGKFKDLAGDWDLTLGSGCSQSNVTPWSN